MIENHRKKKKHLTVKTFFNESQVASNLDTMFITYFMNLKLHQIYIFYGIFPILKCMIEILKRTKVVSNKILTKCTQWQV